MTSAVQPLLITGGSGYLGTRLTRVARRRGPTVATYFRHAVAFGEEKAVALDVRDPVATRRLIERVRPRAVIHTAISTAAGEMEDVIIGGTENVTRATAAVGARLIHLSTDVAFDGRDGWYREEAPLRPLHPYGRAKAAAEEAVASLAEDYVIVRTSLVTGFSPPDPRTAWVLDSIRQEKPITLFTDEMRCPIWVCDLVEACLRLTGNMYTGVLHVAGPQALSRYELGVTLARLYGLDPAGLTPGLSTESGLARPVNCTLDTGRARELLGMRWHTIPEGYHKEIAGIVPR